MWRKSRDMIGREGMEEYVTHSAQKSVKRSCETNTRERDAFGIAYRVYNSILPSPIGSGSGVTSTGARGAPNVVLPMPALVRSKVILTHRGS